MTDSLRRRSRIQTGHTGSLCTQAMCVPVLMHNLSLKGLLCEVDEVAAPDAPVPAPGMTCIVKLPLATGVTITLEGEVVRVELDGSAPARVAVDFTGMDPDSYAHLRNLVRFSAPDADAIDEEELKQPFSE
ncbi:PilZ domain-containing protein [Megalodesulfovibrio paquesii]